MAKKSQTAKFRIYTRKIKSSFMIYVDFESFLVLKTMGSKIQMSLVRINIKIMFQISKSDAVYATN